MIGDEFKDKTIIITGGGTGIGRSFAAHFAARGATVVLAARQQDRLEATAKKIRDNGGKAIPVELDIRKPGMVDDVMDRVLDETGRIDVMINNAAGNFIARAEDLTPNGWNAVINIVLNGSAYCALAAGKRMLKQGSGKIMSVVASYAWMGGPGTVHSAAAKAGVIAMTKTLAVEWGPRNIQVNCLCPGFVDTEQSRSVLWPTKEAQDHLLARIPAGRFGTIEETVGAGAFLCSPAADYINGEVLTIDGGEWLNKGAFILPEGDRHAAG
ncbi:MAG: SDR family oxidoreductase [Parvibaculum sp.]|uniref:SDR family oxidoreductase n=1 Tax=Parvibaculum sp. TaxID=2024848 RepID=UPI003C729E19